MIGQYFIFTKQLKNRKWRLYKNQSQSITSWRGDNDKITVVREERCSQNNYGEILTFNTKEDAQKYSREVLNTLAFDE